MVTAQTEDKIMDNCSVCGSRELRKELVNEVFMIAGKPVLVENIPAKVCVRCGEIIFSREITEKIRSMVHGEARPIRTLPMDVFTYP